MLRYRLIPERILGVGTVYDREEEHLLKHAAM